MDNIKNKTVLITGGAGGLGSNFAVNLLREGAKAVAILDLKSSDGDNVVAKLEKEFGKGRALFLECDITNHASFDECFKKAAEILNGIDILINNAGVSNEKDWQKTIDLNFSALVNCTYTAMECMGKHKGGRGGTILNISSLAGLESVKGLAVYCGTKHAVIGFSGAMKKYYKESGIRVLVLCPGLTTTSMTAKMPEQKIDLINIEETLKMFATQVYQSPEHVANAMIELLKKGENGATWVIANNEAPLAVNLPDYTKYTVPV